MWGPAAKEGPKFPKSYGDTPNGSIMAFKVSETGAGVSLIPAWISRDLDPPAPPAIANGVVYALQQTEHTNQHPNNPEGHGRPVNGVPAPPKTNWASTAPHRTTP